MLIITKMFSYTLVLLLFSIISSILASITEPTMTTETSMDVDDIVNRSTIMTTLSSEVQSDVYINISDCNCGHRMIRQPKIINGSDALHGQHPWMISLMLDHRHHCGGSLINRNWVLTAAHCVYRIEPKRFKVKLGSHIRNKDFEPTAIIINEMMTFPHPGFSFSTFADDLALIRLSRKVTYTNYIQPICLPNKVSEMAENKAVVIGWGKIRQGGFSANILQEVELPVVDNFKCINWYRKVGKLLTIRSTQICAGFEEGGKDACQGDSGSPMLVTDKKNKRSTVVGIVSAGIGCALPKLPGIYTKVSAYLPWIKETMKKYDQQVLSSTATAAIPTTTKRAPSLITNTEFSIELTTVDNKSQTQQLMTTKLPLVEEQQIKQTTLNDTFSISTLFTTEPLSEIEDDSSQTIEPEHNNLLSLITSFRMT